jgi:2-C-methyl-D-erythritol 2,4-cyclodiphosphate synthase
LSNTPAFRIGHGYDIHRLRAGGQLLVGGVVVSHEMSADAHSDGDVAIHALVDAIFGALGEADIGEHFPNTDLRWHGADSLIFLRHAMDIAKRAGYAVVNADITVQAEKPKLKSFKSAMRAVLSEVVGAPVNIKAGTNETCDAIGRGEAIAAHAVVLLACYQ